jgi:sec-independent protein translocase protein TatA
MFGNIGTGELILILLVVILLFGAKKIPDLAQGIGKGIKEFKKALRDVEEDIEKNNKNSSSSDKKN